MQNVLDRVVKLSIYSLVFLVPLFFLPFSFEAFEFNKQYLLFFLVSLGFLAWVGKMVVYDKEIRFQRTSLDVFVLGFLFVAILSAIFSVDKSSSLYGLYGRFSNGLIGLLSLGALYFLVTNNVTTNRETDAKKERETDAKLSLQLSVSGLIKTLLYSSGVAVLMGYFSIFGVWAKIGNLLSLPRIMMQRTFNPTAGSLEGLSIFLAVLVAFLVGIILLKEGKKLLQYLLLFASLGLLVIVDFTAAWIVLLTTLVLFVGFSLWRRIFRENVNSLLIPVFLIIIAASLIPFQPLKFNLPQEQVLNQPTSWSVAFRGATDDVKSGFLGSGIGNFHYDFAKHKPVEFNQSWLWQIRFDRAGSYFAEILGTLGFLGILSYLALVGMFLLVSWFMLQRRFVGMPLMMGFIALLVAQFVYYQNTTLAFMFWLVLGLAVVSWQNPIKKKVISFKDFPEMSLIFSTMVIVLGVSIFALYFFAGKFYMADMNYAKALSYLGDKRIQFMEKAVGLNPYFPQYRVGLARTYLNEALTTQDSVRVQIMAAKSINEARAATVLQPSRVANWETLGVVYREIKGLATGATNWGIKSFETAISLEPTNPVLYTELGKMYLAVNDVEKARESFDKAIEKKSNYADALIQQALLLEKEDILDEAVERLEDLVRENPFSIEVLFQLGRLYFNNGQVDDAILQFKRVVILVPNHSNAHYSLGVAYTSQGQRSLAIQAFEKVLELNPGNQDVQQKLKSLRP